MTLKPWRLIAEPHEDVRSGTFVQAEFAADITRVHTGTAAAEYQDPKLFFQRTFITEGMRLLLDSVVNVCPARAVIRSFSCRQPLVAARPTPCWRLITWRRARCRPVRCRELGPS